MFFKNSNIEKALQGIKSGLPELMSTAISEDEILADKQIVIDALIKRATKLYELNKPESEINKKIRTLGFWTSREEITDFLSESDKLCKSMHMICKKSSLDIIICIETSNKIIDEISRLNNIGLRNKELEGIVQINNKRLSTLAGIERVLKSIIDYLSDISSLCNEAMDCEKRRDFQKIIDKLEKQKMKLIQLIKSEVIITKDENMMLIMDSNLIHDRFRAGGILDIYEKFKQRRKQRDPQQDN